MADKPSDNSGIHSTDPTVLCHTHQTVVAKICHTKSELSSFVA